MNASNKSETKVIAKISNQNISQEKLNIDENHPFEEEPNRKTSSENCDIGCDNEISVIKPEGNNFNDTEESLSKIVGLEMQGNNASNLINSSKRRPFEKINFKENK